MTEVDPLFFKSLVAYGTRLQQQVVACGAPEALRLQLVSAIDVFNKKVSASCKDLQDAKPPVPAAALSKVRSARFPSTLIFQH
jgi:hypothetical protein